MYTQNYTEKLNIKVMLESNFKFYIQNLGNMHFYDSIRHFKSSITL